MPEIHFGQLLVGVPTLKRFNALSTMIEELGYDSLHAADGAGSWDPFILGAEMARSTKNIPLRLTVINPYYMVPIKISLACATLQHASKGRFGISFGGGSQDMLHSYGKDWDHPAPTIRESITVLRSLIKGETTSFQGKYVKADGNDLWFPAPSEVPVYIGCQRKWLVRLAGEICQGVVLDSATPEYAPWALEQLHIGAARVNRDLDKEIEDGSFWFQSVLPLNISEDRKVAFDRIRRSIPFTFQTMSEERRKRSGVPESFVNEIQNLMKRQTKETFDQAEKLCTEGIVTKLSPVGTPEDVIRYLKRGIKEGYNGFCFHVSTKLGRGAEETLKMFAEHVMPEFR